MTRLKSPGSATFPPRLRMRHRFSRPGSPSDLGQLGCQLGRAGLQPGNSCQVLLSIDFSQRKVIQRRGVYDVVCKAARLSSLDENKYCGIFLHTYGNVPLKKLIEFLSLSIREFPNFIIPHHYSFHTKNIKR